MAFQHQRNLMYPFRLSCTQSSALTRSRAGGSKNERQHCTTVLTTTVSRPRPRPKPASHDCQPLESGGGGFRLFCRPSLVSIVGGERRGARKRPASLKTKHGESVRGSGAALRAAGGEERASRVVSPPGGDPSPRLDSGDLRGPPVNKAGES
eukprot:9491674-Pyramimonas_sp.AAC.3